MTQPTTEEPVYAKFQQRREDGTPSSFWATTCDEGWRSSIICTDMYEWVADWLLTLLERRPLAPDHRP